MASLRKKQQNEINEFLKNSGLLEAMNNYLQQNGLPDFEIDSVKLKPRAAQGGCPPNHDRVEVCNSNGKCEWICVPRP